MLILTLIFKETYMPCLLTCMTKCENIWSSYKIHIVCVIVDELHEATMPSKKGMTYEP